MRSEANISLNEYCRKFIGSSAEWPALPLTEKPAIKWWKQWLDETPAAKHFESLRSYLPQLWINPQIGASGSITYKNLVLRGEAYSPLEKGAYLRLNDEKGFSVHLAVHACGTFPVIEIKDQADFVQVVRCLAYRCEKQEIVSSVHAQAVAGLIHWGLLRKIDQQERAELIILHRSPYSSLPECVIPGNPTEEQWVELSQVWRLEHELTHLATQRLVGEMRLNLFDELIADSLGMLKALGLFSADIFRQGLGLEKDGSTTEKSRVHTYLKGLNQEDRNSACSYVLQRADELEGLLKTSSIRNEPIELLRYLTKQKLDKRLVMDHS